MANYASTERLQTVAPAAALYRPSWVDRLLERRKASRFPAWFWYAALGLSIYLILAVIVWLDGSSPFAVLPIVAYDGAAYVITYLALMHYLDGVAQRAFASFRPFLTGLEPGESEQLNYELTTMPARSTLLAGAAGLLGTATGLVLLKTSGAAHLTPVLPGELVILFLGNFMIATYLYHTVRQLRVVSRLHAAATPINLFRREPAYAFSRLTARTGASWVLAFMLGLVPRISLDLELLFGPLAWLPMLTATVLAFVLPLLSMHRLLLAEKRRLQRDINGRIEVMLGRLHQRIDDDNYNNVDGFKVALDSLLAERDLVGRIPTWPWNLGTLVGYLSAVLLPIIVWLVQEMLEDMFVNH